MVQLLDIFGFISVLLRGATLAFQSLVIGSVVFELCVMRGADLDGMTKATHRLALWSSIGLALSQSLFVLANSAILMQSTEMPLAEVIGANYFIAGCLTVACAIVIGVLSQTHRWQMTPLVLLSLTILASSVMTSHAAARVEHRALLTIVTGLHQAATASWIGGLPYLLIVLSRCRDNRAAVRISRRFSRVAAASVGTLAGAGLILSLFYVDSISGLYGNAYGVMLMSKIALLGLLLVLGGTNFFIVRRLNEDSASLVTTLRRFAEAEIGIGITVILAAASLTSQPPSVDVTADRVTATEIVERFTPHWPRLESPDPGELSVPTLQTLRQAAASGDRVPESYVPGQVATHPNTPADIAWSEYNHHWAGLLVLIMGLLAFAARTTRARWARNWPFVLLGLAVFLLLRSDPENWPLGPNGFWESFSDSEVLQHRAFVVMLVLFAAFEWRVQTGRLASQGAALIFPVVCAVGGALLMTHSHSLGNVKEELLAEMSHVTLALLGVTAGWSRWLELRVASKEARFASFVWPACFTLVGLILLIYREG